MNFNCGALEMQDMSLQGALYLGRGLVCVVEWEFGNIAIPCLKGTMSREPVFVGAGDHADDVRNHGGGVAQEVRWA